MPVSYNIITSNLCFMINSYKDSTLLRNEFIFNVPTLKLIKKVFFYLIFYFLQV